ncbi:Helix-turn-helix domain protein [Pelagimonas phthalicica]|uniref:Helix-turn-helix domain protein n=1 Tax=Pelagimonas phthalicica TaxID=1037362 RepID=A0A238JD25_9RHOB|nr:MULTISPECIES: helix-turn-helix transcriptional regulator [Roseobacteraceae]TDS91235.1 Cro/C1-type helix-turn-helix DNA-binding protein [Pelagimonas phthalicica]SMX28283.1 Helix-turn-helix domain protein [Pelagimonas phthalicica]
MPSDLTKTVTRRPSPAELRSMLGANLRQLSNQAASISALCRELGINRTQYNRYLAGESFPRPDVLHRICSYFEVDARILLEPVEKIENSSSGLLTDPAIAEYVSGASRKLTEDEFPSGFYRFARRSFMEDAKYVQGLIYVFRNGNNSFLKGFEAKDAMRQQGLPTDPSTREFRGALLPQEDGVAALVSRKGSATTSFNYLARIPSFENNFWAGYVTRTVRENVAGRRVERLVYEYLGTDTGKVLAAARVSGFCDEDGLVPYHKNLLKVGQDFT